MKKISYLILGLAGLTLASCSQDDLQAPTGASGNYNVTVKLPAEMGTRAVNMNTGLTANKLSYAVYDSDGVLIEKNTTTFTEESEGALSTTVAFNLAAGQSYKISFFAQADGSEDVYTFSAENKTMTVDYDAMTNEGLEEDDLYDCFINLLTTGVIGTEVTNTSVLLNRPIAQINWGTNDATKTSIQQYYGTNLKYIQSTLSTTAYTTFDLLANDVDKSQTTNVELGNFTRPLTEKNAVAGFPVGGYQYVAMQYVLAPQSEDILDLNLSINNQVAGNTFDGTITNDVVVSNAPVQANFRTNIYGSLLSEDLEITVTKNQNWGGAFNLPQGDPGEKIADGLWFNESIKTYTITSEDGLEYYAENIAVFPASGSSQQLSGYTVLLGEDLDMKDVEHTPFNNAGAIFDGQGHTISNLTVAITEGNGSAGFMSSAIGTVQNLNFENANISGNYKAGVLAGDGLCAKISNISVNGAVVTSKPWIASKGYYDDGNNAGGIVGYLSAEPNASVTNCSVSDLTITAYRKVGGIVGFANGVNVIVENNTVTNSSIKADQQLPTDVAYDGAPKAFEAGEICGGWTDGGTVRNNTPTKVSVTTISADGKTAASVADQAALQAVVSTPNATITLQPGSYTFPSKPGSGVVITGTTDVKIQDPNPNDAYPVSGYSKVTFKGITIYNPTKNSYNGVQGNDITFDSCVIDGLTSGYGENWTYTNCTFTSGYWCMWSYTATNLVFNDCTFFTETGRGINVYNEAAGNTYKLTFNKCTFKSAAVEPGNAAIMIKVTNANNTSTFDVTLNGCTATGFSTDNNTNNELWSYQTGAKYKVTVDGQVFESAN